MSFWSTADFAFQHGAQDSINDEIWCESARIHEDVGLRPSELVASGSYGAQQAMLDLAIALPWVPDVLGSEWDHCEAVHIVGMAYAGFIKGISDRCFPFDDYLRASKSHWREFAELYVRHVVQGDSAYYEPLCPILECFGSESRFSLLDLCRASLVKRGEGNARRDRPISFAVKKPADDYQRRQECVALYCERAESQRWTWERLRRSHARLVIALGHTAEHGLLNLFLKEQQCVWDSSSRKRWRGHKNSASPLWTVHYAGSGPGWKPCLTIGGRLKSPTWWCVGPSLLERPRWHVIPVYHPSGRFGKDANYARTVQFLRKVRTLIDKE